MPIRAACPHEINLKHTRFTHSKQCIGDPGQSEIIKAISMKMNIKLNVRNRLFLGFATILVIMIAVSMYTHLSLSKTEQIKDRLLHLRMPTVQAGAEIENGINLSLAGLRGYMILGKNPAKAAIFKNERSRGWHEIDNALAKMEELSKTWTDPKNVELLKEMRTEIEIFRIAQQEVETISHTSENIPAFNMLLTEAVPRASKIMAAITSLINEEASLESTNERKHLLKLFADSRGSFAIGLANIRAYLLSGDIQFRDNFNAKWEINEARFNEINNKMTGLLSIEQKATWQEYSSVREEFAPYPENMFKLRSAPDWNLANYYLGTKAAPRAKRILEILQAMRQSQNTLQEKDAGTLDAETNISLVMLIGTFIVLLLGGAIAWFLSRTITVPLRAAVERAKKIAVGDLTTAEIIISGDDELAELGNAINTMNSNLREVISEVSKSTGELASAATQMKDTALQTSQGMENQHTETDQVATAMTEMSATVQEVARNAAEAAISATEADKQAAEGKHVVTQNMESIHALAASIELASSTINKLGEDTKGVDDIVAVISGIANQTNLLALNAAIEAARAGEQGRGFAVVADEVRSLAANTQKSTEEIRSMLDKLKTGASDAVNAMNEGHAQAQRSVEQANTAGDSLTAITNAVAAINNMNTQIATASEEQSAVAEEMNRSIVRISSEAEATLENTRQTRTVAEQVGALSTHLQEIVTRFKIN